MLDHSQRMHPDIHIMSEKQTGFFYSDLIVSRFHSFPFFQGLTSMVLYREVIWIVFVSTWCQLSTNASFGRQRLKINFSI